MCLDVSGVWRENIDDVLKALSFAAWIMHAQIIGSFADVVKEFRMSVCHGEHNIGDSRCPHREGWGVTTIRAHSILLRLEQVFDGMDMRPVFFDRHWPH
jgi:hypothetical protein